MNSQEKNFVENIYRQLAEDTRATRTLAHNMRQNNRELLSGDKFINELLQNADDAAAESQNKDFNAYFVLTDHYLIFSHNGNQFNEQDVNAIADSANPDRAKTVNKNQTGNKGIGFKSVFSIANYVLILSNRYTFRFEEDYEKWADRVKDTPWEIIPIWTEKKEIPKDVLPHLDMHRVNFVFRLRNYENRLGDISNKLILHCENPKNILFLRAIRSIEFKDMLKKTTYILKSQEITSVSIEDKSYEIKNLEIQANNKSSHWYVYNNEISLPKSLHESIQPEDVIPDKYKESIYTLPIHLAACHENNKLIASTGNNIYCTFSTEINLNFPFSVNSDFLLDPSRCYLQNNAISKKWNSFILANIFAEQFIFAKYLAQKANLWASILRIIAIPDEKTLATLFTNEQVKNFNSSFFSAKDKHSFISNLTRKEWKIPRNVQTDPYEFISKFGNDSQKDSCVNPQLERQELLKILGGTEFNIDSIIKYIKTAEFIETISTAKSNYAYIAYLYELYNKLTKQEQQKFLTALKTSPLLFINDVKLCKTPNLVSFYDERLQNLFKETPFIHFLAQDFKLDDPLKNWLKQLGVKNLTFKEAINIANQHEDDLVSFTLNMIKQSQHLLPQDWNELKQLKLKVDTLNFFREFSPASSCYLSKEYAPTTKIEDYADAPDFLVVKDYLDELPDKVQSVKDFLVKIGVKQDLDSSDKNLIQAVARSSQEKQIHFIRYLFDTYFVAKDKTKLKKFTSTIISKLSENGLKLLTPKGQFYPVTECYLGDFYQPEEQLQQAFSGLNYVSEAYVDDKKNLKQWQQFFKVLGVQTKFEPKITEEVNISRNTLCSKYTSTKLYFNYLDQKELYGKSYPSVRKWTEQHSIDYFLHIEQLDVFLNHRLFWNVIASQWNNIKLVANYKTKYTQDEVPSSIQYYVIQACQKVYQKNPSELYAITFPQDIGKEAPELANVEVAASLLTEDKLKKLEFKTVLSISDCLLLLDKISQKPFDESTLEKLRFIYKHLLKHNSPAAFSSNDLTDTDSTIKLLNQKNEFVLIKDLYALCCDKLSINQPNSKLFKHLNKMALPDFELLCQCLGVKIIRENDLQVVQEHIVDHNGIIDRITAKIPYFILIQAKKLDKDTDSLLKAYIDTCLPIYYDKLKDLQSITSQTLSITFSDVLVVPVPVWIAGSTFYLREGYTGPLHRKFYEHLYQLLDLSLDIDLLWEIIEAPGDELQQEYSICSKSNLEYVSQQLEIIKQQANSDIAESNALKRKRADCVKKDLLEIDAPDSFNIAENEEPAKKQARYTPINTIQEDNQPATSTSQYLPNANPIGLSTQEFRTLLN